MKIGIVRAWIAMLGGLLLLAICPCAQAQYNYLTNGDSVIISAYWGSGGVVTIPDTVNGLHVARIANGTFANRTDLTSVTIPDSVTDIGVGAFQGCSNLSTLALGASVVSIENNAFASCISLAKLILPGSITAMGSSAFGGCSSLASVTINAGATAIGSYAFSNCASLSTLAIPGSVKNVGDDAFYACTGLTNVNISGTIGNWEFDSCTNLAEVTINPDVTNTGTGAFQDCIGLTNITIPGSVTALGNSLFTFDRFSGVELSYGLTSVGPGAFSSCTNLSSIVIPDSVTNIDYVAFSACTHLESAVIPDSVKKIGEGAFEGCTRLTNVTIPRSLTTIASESFSGCASLVSVVIPATVTNIGVMILPVHETNDSPAFDGCTQLKAIYFLGDAPEISPDEFTGDTHATVYYYAGASGWGSTFGGLPTVALKPSLNVANAASSASFSWPAVNGYFLQQSSLLTPGSWSPVNLTSVLTTNGGVVSFSVPTSVGSLFYRLHRP